MKAEWTQAQVDVIENTAYTVGIMVGERMERSRMEKILAAGEENRQADIQLGRHLERERILELLEGERQTVDRGLPVDDIIALIERDV
jgi:hypothetical protein